MSAHISIKILKIAVSEIYYFVYINILLSAWLIPSMKVLLYSWDYISELIYQQVAVLLLLCDVKRDHISVRSMQSRK